MMQMAQRVRAARKGLAWSQSELARQSGISLPFIQRIEASKANPSFETLQALLGPLGLDLRIEARLPDWNLLADLGAPLAAYGRKSSIQKNYHELTSVILRTLSFFETEPLAIQKFSREYEATAALLLAIQSHYPLFFGAYLTKASLILEKFRKQPLTGRMIKLRRIALANISKYL